MKKYWNYFVRFWKGIWNIVKSMGNWRGVLSLLIVWLALSGSGVFILGFIISDSWLMGIGSAIYAFWLLPGTPLIAINIAVAMVVQRFVFLDKNVTWEAVKTRFKEAFEEDEKDQEDCPEEETIIESESHEEKEFLKEEIK